MARRFYYVQSVIIRLRSSRSSPARLGSARSRRRRRPTSRARPAYSVACSSIIPKHHTSRVYPRVFEAPDNETSEIVYPCRSPNDPGDCHSMNARVRRARVEHSGGERGTEYLWSVARRRNARVFAWESRDYNLFARAPMTRNVNSLYYAGSAKLCASLFFFFPSRR